MVSPSKFIDLPHEVGAVLAIAMQQDNCLLTLPLLDIIVLYIHFYSSIVILVLSAYVSRAEFQYADLTWKKICGSIAHLIAESGMGKGQPTSCIETIIR